MSDRAATTFALAPETTPGAVATIAEAAGYRPDDATDLSGDGLPDRAVWTRGDDRLTYARDMATGLQTLVIQGETPPHWPAALPLIDEATIETLLASNDEAQLLAGLQAAAISGATALAPLVAARVATLDAALADYVLAFAAAQPAAARPGPIATPFPAPGGRQEKLKLLRWLGKEGPDADGGIGTAMVAGGLEDGDWEVRATAMLAAARIAAVPLAGAIARLALPESDEDGVTRRERSALLALRDAALARLGASRDRALPPGVAEALDGDYAALPADLRAFVHALAEPVPKQLEQPVVPGVVWTETGPRRIDGRLLAWVPPVPHWLGDDGLVHGAVNPSRLVTPAHGFLIDAEPAGEGTLVEARAKARATGTRLPTSDEWEMAARGPDGRRFPWGMNARAPVDLSPWGMAGIIGGNGEWVESETPDGHGLVAGGWRLPVAAHRVVASDSATRLFRFVYHVI